MRTSNLAIVFTDIVGYAVRLSRQPYEQSQRMLRLHEELVLPVFRAYRGRRVKSIGGTLLVTFESPTDAVLCASAVQDRIWEWNKGVPEWDRIKVRVGVNVGEVRLEKGDVFGEPVNIAARVLGLADAGEVLFTEAIWLSMNRNEIEAVSREVQGMRAGPRRTYYEGRLQEERKEYEGAARSFETAARAGERRAFERLLEMAQSGPCEARVGAARALGRLGDQDAVKVLESMEKEAREGPQQGLLAHVMGCNSRVAAHDALEQIRGAP